MSSETTAAALAERLDRLAEAFRDDYPGRELDSGLLRRVRWWCADKAVPSVSADPDGGIVATWHGQAVTLAVRLSPGGGAQWAGLVALNMTYGDGYPAAADWPLLVRAQSTPPRKA